MTQTTTNTPEAAHSDVVGGSTAAQRMACPGSMKLERKVAHDHKLRILAQMNKAADTPDDAPEALEDVGKATLAMIEKLYREETTSTYAEEGTDLHTCMEFILENDVDVEEVAGRKFGNTIITPELYEDFVVPALDAFDAYCDLVEEEDGEDFVFLVENKVEVPGIPGGFGTADIIGKTSKRLAVLDWKGGAGVPVSPVDSKQGMFYGRGAAHSLEEWLDFPIDERTNQPSRDLRVDIIIVQPRTAGPAWEMWTTTYGVLEDFRNELVRKVAEALSDNPTIAQGDHCRFCDAKHICPAKQQLAGRILERIDAGADAAVVDTDNDPDDVPIDVAVDMAVSQSDFTPEELADWLAEVPLVTAWAKAVTALAYKELEAGRDVPGKGLDQGLANASYSIPLENVDRRLQSYGLDVNERRKVSPITPTQARKLTAAKTKAETDPDKKAALAKKQALLEKIIERKPGTIKMVDIEKVKNPVKTSEARRVEIREKMGLADDTKE